MNQTNENLSLITRSISNSLGLPQTWKRALAMTFSGSTTMPFFLLGSFLSCAVHSASIESSVYGENVIIKPLSALDASAISIPEPRYQEHPAKHDNGAPVGEPNHSSVLLPLRNAVTTGSSMAIPELYPVRDPLAAVVAIPEPVSDRENYEQTPRVRNASEVNAKSNSKWTLGRRMKSLPIIAEEQEGMLVDSDSRLTLIIPQPSDDTLSHFEPVSDEASLNISDEPPNTLNQCPAALELRSNSMLSVDIQAFLSQCGLSMKWQVRDKGAVVNYEITQDQTVTFADKGWEKAIKEALFAWYAITMTRHDSTLTFR